MGYLKSSKIEVITAANKSGARIMANIATSAMSSANAVAHTVITEAL